MPKTSKKPKENLPPSKVNLKIVDGEILLENGESPKKYLKRWQKENGHKNGTPIRILTNRNYEILITEASFSGIA